MRLEDEFTGQIEIEWRSYLLRPTPNRRRDPEKFRQYTESWRRPAGEPDAGVFQVWSSEAPPPSHSIPAHRAAKAAARISKHAFRAMHERLMTAYFNENRDISDPLELEVLWTELGLAPEALALMGSQEIEAEIMRDFEEAQRFGATGVPGVRRADNEIIIVGAQPEAIYRRWIEKSLAEGITT